VNVVAAAPWAQPPAGLSREPRSLDYAPLAAYANVSRRAGGVATRAS